ncbi:cyclic AMP-responsive element-binding protein 5 isoform X1 [Ictalurus punctatus]|uniref:Cyclic AMP-dependent transcription factor ATF-2 n=1 Tax=Ictalurus punctatus TaxID=7998 RepID=W5UAI5_ICTPU|nr:cyclic AMP-responsive element-binding protein 5 isoform X1 [Ictalurus punctatus]XP_017309869.1 cyclic AMP-responsive element-binding protein 5 isoform X1 [Ictalurus punctatus]
MNTDQEGPYVCTAPGCTQRFQREDHLLIHRHKHEMTLKFSSIKCDNTLSDQTPTPTRFLRNCEEVGLFSDLELNQASDEDEEESEQNFSVQGSSRESGHHGSQQQQCALAQFHTNHLHTHTSHSSSHCSMVRHTTHSTTNTQSGASCLHNQQRNPAACAMQAAPSVRMNTQLPMDPSMTDIPGPTHSRSCPTPQRSKVMSCQTHPMVSNGNQNTMGHMMEMMSPQHARMGLPLTHMPASPHQSFQQHGLNQSQHRHTHQHQSQEQSPHSCAHHSPPAHLHPGPAQPPAKQLTRQPIPAQTSPVPKTMTCAESPLQTSGGKRRRTADDDPDERRRKFLERNRAAASRCRQKRKVWVTSLEKKAEELTHTNLQLQNEVTLLKSEVIQLKQLLLAHKDCPVTVRQRETQVGSPTGSPIQTQNIQHNSISSSVAHTHLTTRSHSAS